MPGERMKRDLRDSVGSIPFLALDLWRIVIKYPRVTPTKTQLSS